MRYPPEHNDASRARILEAAARLFRAHGVEGVGLAKIMTEAGLTVGTFYTHFASKEELVRESLVASLRERNDALRTALLGGDLEPAIRAYLSAEHRDATGAGCPAAALAADVGRQALPTREAFSSELELGVDLLVDGLTRRRGEPVNRAEGAALFGLLVGTLQLARVTPDRAASADVLEAGVRAALTLVEGGRDRAGA